MPGKSAEEEPETIAQRLRRLRREMGGTQPEMAERLGASQRNLKQRPTKFQINARNKVREIHGSQWTVIRRQVR